MQLSRLLLCLAVLSGCQPEPGPRTIQPLLRPNHLYQPRADEFVAVPQPRAFSICYGHSCRHTVTTGLTSSEWQSIRALFATPAATPGHEREIIRQAIAQLETLVGARTGTAGDRAGVGLGVMAGAGLQGQLDCIDEAVNTTVYLTLLQNAGLLQHHQVLHHRSRGFLNLGGPHSTAMVREIGSGEEYAIDSWFRDNGEPPYVVPYGQWYWGWTPPGW